MPKAAVVTHFRMFMAGVGFSTMFGITSDDIVYTVLPLYHRCAGCMWTGYLAGKRRHSLDPSLAHVHLVSD